MLKIRFLLYCFLFLSFFCPLLCADTVIYRNGKREKGLVIETFKDRIVFSSINGETVIMKADIKAVIYDSPEKVLLQKGKNQLKRKQYIKAYYTFEEASNLDPENIEADAYMRHMRSLVETKIRSDVIDGIRAKKEKFEGVNDKGAVDKVRNELGIVLSRGKEYVIISGIISSEISDQLNDIRPGDRIVSIWGEKTAYMDESEVAERLLIPGEIRLTIERDVNVLISDPSGFLNRILPFRYGKLIGARLRHGRLGLTVDRIYRGGPFYSAGVKKGDVVYFIGNRNTRYLDKYQLEEILRSGKGKKLNITIRRDITFWKKGKAYE